MSTATCRTSWELFCLSTGIDSASLVHTPPAIPCQKLSVLSTNSQHEKYWISLVLLNHPVPLPASPTTYINGPGGTLTWWHACVYKAQGALENELWLGRVQLHVFIFVFSNPPSQVLVQLYIPHGLLEPVWRKTAQRASPKQVSNQISTHTSNVFPGLDIIIKTLVWDCLNFVRILSSSCKEMPKSLNILTSSRATKQVW